MCLPLEQKEFGAKGWPHSTHHAVATRTSRSVEHKVLHNRKDRGGRQISTLTKAVPGSGESVGRQAKTALHGFENLGSSTMEDEAANLPHTQVVVRQEALYGVTEFRVDKFRDVGGKDNIETALIDIPSHQVLRVGG